MEYVQMTLNDWVEIKQKLKRELIGVKQSFVRIGYMLRKISDQKAYEQDGYKSIAEFANKELGLHPSTTTRLMQINQEFSIGGYSERLKPEYIELNKGQLEAMLKLADGDRQMIQPETPREDIRELNRFNKAEPAAGEADEIQQLVEKFYKDNPEILNEVFNSSEFDESNIRKFSEIVNPGGNRSYKKGMFFLMMYENRIAIKKFGQNPQNMTWWEFYQLTREIFEEAAGPNTWANYFGEEEHGETKESVGTGAVEETSHEEKRGTTTATVEDPAGVDRGRAEKAETDSKREKNDRVPSKGHEGNVLGREKQQIAPAQVDEKIPEKSEPKVEERQELKRPESVEEKEKEVVVEGPYGSRKDYIDTLTEQGLATYLCSEYGEGRLIESMMRSVEELEAYLLEEVDDQGKPLE